MGGDDGMGVLQGDAEDDEGPALDEDGNPIAGGSERKKTQRRLRFKENQGLATLEQEKNISVTSFDTQHEVDPLFRQTTQKFDEMRIGNLMSSTLTTTPTLLLQLDSHTAYTSNLADDETGRRQSGQSGASRKSEKLANSYLEVARQTFDVENYQRESRREVFFCPKYEALM